MTPILDDRGEVAVDCSVLMPVLNEARDIEATVRAMRGQHFDGHLEFLIVDGGSTDGTIEILERLAAEDPRIRVLKNPRSVTSSGLNVGLRHARGRYVARSVPTLEDQPDAKPPPEGRRLRVLHVVNLHDAGGAERFGVGLATHLPSDRFEIWVCCPRGTEREVGGELQRAKIPVVDLGRRRKWDVHRFVGLARLIREHRFDIVHTHMFGSNIWGSVIGRSCRVPVIIAHEHTWAYQGDPLRAWIDGRVIGRLVTRFVAVSNADAERMVSYERVPRQKVVVMPTAYIPGADTGPSDIRMELGLRRETPVIATAVVMRPQKALEVLLDAHALVLSRMPDAQLVIAGDGPRRRHLEEYSRRLNLGRHVHFLGSRTDVDAIVAAADVGALSSDFEGMPLFAFECMAARTPLVATAVGGLPDLFDSGRSAILVPNRDPGALAEALIAVLSDPACGERLAAAAAERLPPYTIDAVARQFGELYERLWSEASR